MNFSGAVDPSRVTDLTPGTSLRRRFRLGQRGRIANGSLPFEVNGKFREIKVEVKGKKLNVRAKRGYWAPAPASAPPKSP